MIRYIIPIVIMYLYYSILLVNASQKQNKDEHITFLLFATMDFTII